MTSFLVKKGDEKAFDKLINQLKKLLKDNDLIIANDESGGTMYAPSKRKKFYRTLPFALSPDCLTKEGDQNFMLRNYRGFGVYFLPGGSVNHEELNQD